MLKLRIETDNDAFADGNENAELARILRSIATRVDRGESAGTVRDGNGNTVGTWAR